MRNVTIVLLMVGVLGVWAAGADAAISETKDSADFNIIEFEGNSVPSAIYGDISDWSVDGNGNYVIAQDGEDGCAGKNGEFNATNGWTMEIRFKVTTTSGKALQLLLGDENVYYSPFLSHDTVYDYGSGQAAVVTGLDFTDDFHTLRVAQESGGGEVKLYIDDVDTGVTMVSFYSLSRQWFGDGGRCDAGTGIEVDYFRLDNTGGYAPVPEPASVVLLLSGGVLAMFRRRKK